MLEILQLHNYSSSALFYIAMIILAAGMVVGYVTDSVMGARGFGPNGNGILIVFGALVGLYVRNAYFGAMGSDDLAVTGVFAGGSAALLLMLLGLAKNWIQE